MVEISLIQICYGKRYGTLTNFIQMFNFTARKFSDKIKFIMLIDRLGLPAVTVNKYTSK